MKILSGLLLCSVGLVVPQARADITFVGSQAGLNAFNVTLHQVSATDVLVTATLTQGAQFFADTGSGQHPGFAFNVAGGAVNIPNISTPWVVGDIHANTSVITGGPDLGTFLDYIDNPGSGTSAHNTGPLSFDVIRASGISINDFTHNAAGYYFAADIADAAGATGESAISAGTTAVPEPSSVVLLLFAVAGVGLIGKKRLKFS